MGHGGGKTRGGLDLASRETLLKGGDSGAVVVPGKARQSKLYRLAARLDEPHMPPEGNKPLDARQLAELARWIDLGAAYDRPLVDRPGQATLSGTRIDAGVATLSHPGATLAVALRGMADYEPQALRRLADGALALDLADETVWRDPSCTALGEKHQSLEGLALVDGARKGSRCNRHLPPYSH